MTEEVLATYVGAQFEGVFYRLYNSGRTSAQDEHGEHKIVWEEIPDEVKSVFHQFKSAEV